MTLREGRQDLYDRLHDALAGGALPWDRNKLRELLREAWDAVLRCPHLDCAYCYTVERAAETAADRPGVPQQSPNPENATEVP